MDRREVDMLHVRDLSGVCCKIFREEKNDLIVQRQRTSGHYCFFDIVDA